MIILPFHNNVAFIFISLLSSYEKERRTLRDNNKCRNRGLIIRYQERRRDKVNIKIYEWKNELFISI